MLFNRGSHNRCPHHPLFALPPPPSLFVASDSFGSLSDSFRFIIGYLATHYKSRSKTKASSLACRLAALVFQASSSLITPRPQRRGRYPAQLAILDPDTKLAHLPIRS